ncbi:MAG: OB-fold nucleic acid binding domain-containing protein, partial [Candidatus Thorarchaeota archaeon]
MDFYKQAGVEPIGDRKRTHLSWQITPDIAGQMVTLMGWVHILRDKGRIKFLVLRDEGGTIQVTIPKKKVSEEIFETAGHLKPETVVAVTGEVVEAPQAKAGVEVIPTEIRILNTA